MPPHRPGGQPWSRGFTRQQFEQWRTGTRTLSTLAATTTSIGFVRTSQGTARLWGGMVSGSTFPLLGSRALLGRTLVEADDADPNVVVLSFDVWRRLFRSDPDIIGKPAEFLDIDGRARVLTIVGIMPADFEFPGERMAFFVPFDPSDTSWEGDARFSLLGTCGPASASRRRRRTPRPSGRRSSGRCLPTRCRWTGRHDSRSGTSRTTRCGNCARRSVCSSRRWPPCCSSSASTSPICCWRASAGRHREMAVRAAMGASRWRIVRGLLAEGLVLAAVGGLVGAVLGALGVALVRKLATVEAPGIFSLMFGDSILPRAHELAVDARVFGIAFGVAALTAILVTVPPALHASRAQPMQAFGGRGGGGSRGASRLRGALVVGEVAIATVLLIAAGLLIHSFSRLSTVDRGYQASNTLVFQLVFPPGHEVARQSDTIETILSRLRAAPGVVAAGFARHGVLIGERITLGTFVPEGRTPARWAPDPCRRCGR